MLSLTVRTAGNPRKFDRADRVARYAGNVGTGRRLSLIAWIKFLYDPECQGCCHT